jgi:hypothetical protein
MASSGMFCHVVLVRIDVSEELSASFIRVTRIGELGTTLAITSNRCTLQRKPERKRPLGRHKCTWEDNIKMDLRDIRRDGMD